MSVPDEDLIFDSFTMSATTCEDFITLHRDRLNAKSKGNAQMGTTAAHIKGRLHPLLIQTPNGELLCKIPSCDSYATAGLWKRDHYASQIPSDLAQVDADGERLAVIFYTRKSVEDAQKRHERALEGEAKKRKRSGR